MRPATARSSSHARAGPAGSSALHSEGPSTRKGGVSLPERSEDRRRGGLPQYRFTGKEEDVEVGLQYFGKRYLNPLLGRWISADPLAVHSPGEADLNVYAYVRGQVLYSIDPVGLQDIPAAQKVDEAPQPKPQPTISSNAKKWVVAGVATAVVVAAAVHPKTRQMARSLVPKAKPVLRPAEKAASRAQAAIREAARRRLESAKQVVQRWLRSDASRDQTASAGDRVSETTVPNQLSPLIRNVSREIYHVYERANARFAVRANLDSKGYIEMSIRTKLEDGTRSKILQAAAEFSKVLKHFEGRAKGFQASWQYGDNLKVFKEQLAKGLTESQAAWKTWTGQQLRKAGYDQVKIVENAGDTVKAVFTKSGGAAK